MKKWIIPVIGFICLIALVCFAANPTFVSFIASQFGYNSDQVWIKSGAKVTNIVNYGTLQLPGIPGGSGKFAALDTNGNVTAAVPPGGGVQVAPGTNVTTATNNGVVTVNASGGASATNATLLNGIAGAATLQGGDLLQTNGSTLTIVARTNGGYLTNLQSSSLVGALPAISGAALTLSDILVKPTRIVFMGDSQGDPAGPALGSNYVYYTSNLFKLFPQFIVATNSCVSGERLHEAAARVAGLIGLFPPSVNTNLIVSYEYGINDLSSFELPTMETDWTNAMSIILRSNALPVAWTIPSLLCFSDTSDQVRIAFNDFVRQHPSYYARLIDVDYLMQNFQSSMSVDGYTHWNADFAKIVSKELWLQLASDYPGVPRPVTHDVVANQVYAEGVLSVGNPTSQTEVTVSPISPDLRGIVVWDDTSTQFRFIAQTNFAHIHRTNDIIRFYDSAYGLDWLVFDPLGNSSRLTFPNGNAIVQDGLPDVSFIDAGNTLSGLGNLHTSVTVGQGNALFGLYNAYHNNTIAYGNSLSGMDNFTSASSIGYGNSSHGSANLFSATSVGNANIIHGHANAFYTHSMGTGNTILGIGNAYFATNIGDGNFVCAFGAWGSVTNMGNGNIVMGYQVDNPFSQTNGVLTIGGFIFATNLSSSGVNNRLVTGAKVGIGTTNLTSTLNVGGDINVIGNLYAPANNLTGTLPYATLPGSLQALPFRTTNFSGFGAVGDGKTFNYAQIAGGSTLLTLSDGTFAPGDVGKYIRIRLAHANHTLDFVSTIASYVDTADIHLTDAVPATGGNTNTPIIFGTGNRAALTNALNWCASNYYWLVVDDTNYCIEGPMLDPGVMTAHHNALVYLPPITASRYVGSGNPAEATTMGSFGIIGKTEPKVIQKGSAVSWGNNNCATFWVMMTNGDGGNFLECQNFTASSSYTGGSAYAVHFNGIGLVMRNLLLMLPTSYNMKGWNLEGVTAADVEHVYSSTGCGEYIWPGFNPNTNSAGMVAPGTSNGGQQNFYDVYNEGGYYGFVFGEHCHAFIVTTMNTMFGLGSWGSGHDCEIGAADVENSWGFLGCPGASCTEFKISGTTEHSSYFTGSNEMSVTCMNTAGLTNVVCGTLNLQDTTSSTMVVNSNTPLVHGTWTGIDGSGNPVGPIEFGDRTWLTLDGAQLWLYGSGPAGNEDTYLQLYTNAFGGSSWGPNYAALWGNSGNTSLNSPPGTGTAIRVGGAIGVSVNSDVSTTVTHTLYANQIIATNPVGDYNLVLANPTQSDGVRIKFITTNNAAATNWYYMGKDSDPGFPGSATDSFSFGWTTNSALNSYNIWGFQWLSSPLFYMIPPTIVSNNFYTRSNSYVYGTNFANYSVTSNLLTAGALTNTAITNAGYGFDTAGVLTASTIIGNGASLSGMQVSGTTASNSIASVVTSMGVGGSQTPWTGTINAASNTLTGLYQIVWADATSTNWQQSQYQTNWSHGTNLFFRQGAYIQLGDTTGSKSETDLDAGMLKFRDTTGSISLQLSGDTLTASNLTVNGTLTIPGIVSLKTNGFTAGASNAIYLLYGTNQLITNPASPPVGTTISYIVKNVFGSDTITNSAATVSNTVPGIGLTNNVTLGAQNSPSNTWTGVWDGANW